MGDATGMLAEWVERGREGVIAEVAASLVRRSGTVFRRGGVEVTTRAVRRLVEALAEDLAAGATARLRATLRATLLELSEAPPGFRDLRLLQETLRGAALARLAVDEAALAAHRALEDWFHELTHQCSLYLITRREEMIDRQAGEIERKLAEQRELSIPIVPIHEGVLVVPLVGNLDAYRAQVLTSRVLAAIAQAQARYLLLDVSGVSKIDGEVMRHLIRTTRAASLLGTQIYLSGIAADAARDLTVQGLDLRELLISRSLQEALSHALAAPSSARAAARAPAARGAR